MTEQEMKQEGIELLKSFEGCSSKVKGKNVICTPEDIEDNITVYPYQCIAGEWTIGWGCVIKEGEYVHGLDVQECHELFLTKVLHFALGLEKIEYTLNQNQFDALLCLAFNIGMGSKKNKSGLLGSSIVKEIEENGADNIELLREKWLAWSKITKEINGEKVKVVVDSLLKRRVKEFELFIS